MIALLVLIGAIIMTVNRGSQASGSTIHPNTGTPSAQAPKQTDPSSPTTGGSSGGTVDLAKACSITVPDGWQLAQQEKGVAVLTNADGDMANAQCATVDDKDPGALVDRWLDMLAEDGTDVKRESASTVKTPTSKLKAAQENMTYTETTSQGSVKYGVTAIATLNSEHLGGLLTVWYTADSDVDQLNKDFGVMQVSLWKSMV
ncbi:hypothetical protein [Microlunatus elymi]|uniref:hypothetical protein n=1 Tax=Microlunatus elymi TaxID=2596828 RepID=UPI00143DDEB4|nr:hypothetical protein [Microlunatus elymi]